jgi:transcriptional regulator with XRE-family HTH domain
MIKEWLMKLFKIEEPKPVSKEESEDKLRREKIKQFKDRCYRERGNRISSILEHLKLSKEELSEKLDLSKESIDSLITDSQQYTKGNNFYKLLYAFTTRLNVNPDYIFAGVGDMFITEEEGRALRRFNFAEIPEDLFTMLIHLKYSSILCFYIAAHYKRSLLTDEYIILTEIEDNKIKLEKK